MTLLLLLQGSNVGGFEASFHLIIPARFDGIAWTALVLEQSATRNGTFTPLANSTLTPVEADPSAPEARDVTVTGTNAESGWIRATLEDDEGNQHVFEAIPYGPSTRPSVLEVARLMPDRATATSGAGLPNFDADTVPSLAAIDGLIDLVLDTVDPHVPNGAAPEIMRAARHVVALTVAILTETGYFGEQRDVNDARVRVWETLLATNQATLDSVAQGDEPGGVRFGSLAIISPTVGAWQRQAGLVGTELLP